MSFPFFLAKTFREKKQTIFSKKEMGWDYDCPSCDGPAFGTNHHQECEACKVGMPSFFECASCNQGVGTVRCGYKKCVCGANLCTKCKNCFPCQMNMNSEDEQRVNIMKILEKTSNIVSNNSMENSLSQLEELHTQLTMTIEYIRRKSTL